MMRTVNTSILLITVIAVLLTAVGCSDDDPVQVQDDPGTGPESPGLLVLQLMDAYEARNVSTYLALLDPDFLMLLTPETMDDFPYVGPTLDFAEEELIHSRMFSGDDVTDPQGHLVPGVQGISVPIFLPLAPWSPSEEDDPISNSVWAPYEVVIFFDRGQNFSTLKVEGTVKLFARAHESSVTGTKETYYLLAGMTELTFLGKGTEVHSWGSVKALYR